jgi:hypothetical protein
MKHMSPQGKYCDLACYPICPGYRREGCLMFNEEESFLSAKMNLIAHGTDIRELCSHPKGLWLKNHTIQMSNKTRPNTYVDEAIN